MDIQGSTAAETLAGTDQDDVIQPGGGADIVTALGGDDVLRIEGNGADAWGASFNGGDGYDTLDASRVTSNLRLVDVGLPDFGFPITKVGNIEHYITGSGNDIVLMLTSAQDLAIETGGGSDILGGGAGNDYLDAGDGLDAAVFFDMFRNASIDFSAGSGTISSDGQGTDTVTAAEYTVFKDGMFTVDQASAAASIARLYLGLFGRPATAHELDDGAHDLGHGVSLAAITDRVMHADAGWTNALTLSDADFVEYLFNQVQGRASDAGGKAYWQAVLANGSTRAEVTNGFTDSGEHKATTAAAIGEGLFVTDEASQLVASLYHAATDRLPDQAGFEALAGAFRTGMRSFTQIADDLASSDEFESHTAGFSHGDLVDYIFSTALHRIPDAGGYAFWLAELDRGLSVGGMIGGVALSDEHMQLIAPAIHGGIAIFG